MYLLAGTVPAAVPVLADAATPEQRPNILFILSDDHTSQSWGIYGGVLADYARNENIRRLAAEGVVLDNCFCTNSISVPSRASILTGRYSHRNGVYTLEDSLDTSLPTIARTIPRGRRAGVSARTCWARLPKTGARAFITVTGRSTRYVPPTSGSAPTGIS